MHRTVGLTGYIGPLTLTATQTSVVLPLIRQSDALLTVSS